MMQKMFTQTQNVAILNVAINFIGVLNHISLIQNANRRVKDCTIFGQKY